MLRGVTACVPDDDCADTMLSATGNGCLTAGFQMLVMLAYLARWPLSPWSRSALSNFSNMGISRTLLVALS